MYMDQVDMEQELILEDQTKQQTPEQIFNDKNDQFYLDEVLNVTEMPAGKRHLQNLKICIDNDPLVEPDPDIAFIKMETDVTEVKTDTRTTESERTNFSVELNNKKLNTANVNKLKTYENREGSFTAGVDIFSKETYAKRKHRAQRFGLASETIEDKKMDIKALYDSLGISDEDLQEGNARGLRFNVIMLRGVNNLNTQEIFKYFSKYPPRNLEWIDDESCNVVFPDDTSANRAMLHMSKPVTSNSIPIKSTEEQEQKSKGQPTKISSTSDDSDNDGRNDDIDLTNILETSLESLPEITDTSKNVVTEKDNSQLEDGEIESDSEMVVNEEALPPGKWRLASPHPKAHRLLMRIATKADRKVAGAEKRSEYYKKYGNPNYGGMTGLISKSKKQKYRRDQERKLEKEAKEVVSGRQAVVYDDEDLFDDTDNEPIVKSLTSTSDADPSIYTNRRKRRRDMDGGDGIDSELDALMSDGKKKPMMKMHADAEEEKMNSYRSAALAELDVRSKIKQRRRDRLYQQFTAEVETEIQSPDLRSRLSRKNI